MVVIIDAYFQHPWNTCVVQTVFGLTGWITLIIVWTFTHLFFSQINQPSYQPPHTKQSHFSNGFRFGNTCWVHWVEYIELMYWASIYASLVAQLVKNLPAMQEAPVQFLGQEDPLEKGQPTLSIILGRLWHRWWRICLQCGRPGFDPRVGKILWRRAWQHIPVSSILAAESPWTEDSSRLQSMGSHRVWHNWVTKHST